MDVLGSTSSGLILILLRHGCMTADKLTVWLKIISLLVKCTEITGAAAKVRA